MLASLFAASARPTLLLQPVVRAFVHWRVCPAVAERTRPVVREDLVTGLATANPSAAPALQSLFGNALQASGFVGIAHSALNSRSRATSESPGVSRRGGGLLAAPAARPRAFATDNRIERGPADADLRGRVEAGRQTAETRHTPHRFEHGVVVLLDATRSH